jgi:hypothetical protein
MTQTQLRMADLYDRLNAIGFSKSFVRQKILPEWWDNELEQTQAAVVEAALYLSRRLNLKASSLLSPEAQLSFEVAGSTKFKCQRDMECGALQVASAIASRLADLVAYACIPPHQPFQPCTAAAVRQAIFQATQRSVVQLDGLLKFCWQQGIPVIHMAEFPPGKKFHGMIAMPEKRPVIIVGLNDASPARLLFVIAHELGHLCKGHITDSTLVDSTIELLDIDDEEEADANEFAVELLLGKPDMVYYTPHHLSGEELADYAQRISQRDGVDAGVVAWNYGFYKKHWGAVRKALPLVEGKTSAQQQINAYLKQYLDWERLSEDNQDYLALMTHLAVEAQVEA